jgi:hypothetical protein
MEHNQVMFMLDPAMSPTQEATRPAWRLPAKSIRPGGTSELPYGEERARRVRRGR